MSARDWFDAVTLVMNAYQIYRLLKLDREHSDHREETKKLVEAHKKTEIY